MDQLIEKICQQLIQTVPDDNWSYINYIFRVVSNWSTEEAHYIVADNLYNFFPSNDLDFFDNTNSNMVKLRKEIYKSNQEKGAFYKSAIRLEKSGKFSISFDYDLKPDFVFEITDESFINDFKEFPRKAEYIPDWLKEILERNGVTITTT
jgi:hypothetical protein